MSSPHLSRDRLAVTRSHQPDDVDDNAMGRMNANIRRLIAARVSTGLRRTDFTRLAQSARPAPAADGYSVGPEAGTVGVALENASAARAATGDPTFADHAGDVTPAQLLLASARAVFAY